LDIAPEALIVFSDKNFCCNGCKTVFEIFSQNGLESYYDLEKSPGATPLSNSNKYDFLDNEKIVKRLLQFDEGNTQIVQLNIPHIHCSSCIWILENLRKLRPEISSSQVNFHEKTVRSLSIRKPSALRNWFAFWALSVTSLISRLKITTPGKNQKTKP
jgi:Cu+-exporting ATPase